MYNFTDNSWTEMMELDNTKTGPGKRFKIASVVLSDLLYVHGGFRLWQGFAHENSVDNDWSDTAQYPLGGYLNDLWVYNKTANAWTNLTEKAVCPDTTGIDSQGISVECIVTWPPSRAGHTAVAYDQAIFIHGGYRAFFPYPTTVSAGAGRGVLGLSGTGYTPYPTHPYYLADMWKYNVSTGIWTQITISTDPDDTRAIRLPPARMGHVMVAANDVFVLFGGYISNFYYDDTWQYNISELRCCQAGHGASY